jgi:hypothetical protein
MDAGLVLSYSLVVVVGVGVGVCVSACLWLTFLTGCG